MHMKNVFVLLAILVLPRITALPQSGPFSSAASLSLDIEPAVPAAGADFTVAVHVNLQGVKNGASFAAALGGFVIPVAFDNTRVTLKSVAGGTAAGFRSDLAASTDVARANARGFVTVVNSHAGEGMPTGDLHVATLTFRAEQGGRVQFNVNSARAGHEGSLASTFAPLRGGGPDLIAYTDAATSVQLDQGKVPYRLIYPCFVSTDSDFQGVAIVNEGPDSADLIFRAYGAGGALLARPGMINPSRPHTLAASSQYAKVVEEMFTMREGLGADRGWVEVESTVPNTSGFFLIGHTLNGTPTEMDGADASHTLAAHLIFPVVGTETGKDTSIYVVNPGSTEATGSLQLQTHDGTTQQTLPVSIPPHGVYERTFEAEVLPSGGYAELQMSAGMVSGLEKFGNARALALLTAQDADRASNVLYAPQLASGVAGTRYFTELNVINPGPQAAIATFHLLDEQGVESVPPLTRAIGARLQLRIRADLLFGLPDPAYTAGYTTGVVRVECDKGLVGNILFGDIEGNFLSSLPLYSTSAAKREIYLDHVALGTVAAVTYWTGVALANASQERDAHIVIELYRSDGQMVGRAARTIPRKSRLVNLISELDPSFNVSQFGGFIRVTSDVEVFAFMLIGDTRNTFLSAVPVR